MGDRSRGYRLGIKLGIKPNYPGQLSLVIPQWVGEMSTSDGYGYRKGGKRRVLRNGGPCDQDCWNTDLVGWLLTEPTIWPTCMLA